MRDKPIREMNSSSDSSGPPGCEQRMHRTRAGSAAVQEGNLIDLSNDMNRNIRQSIQREVERSSPDGTPAGQEKSSFASQVIGLFPFGRGSPQRPPVMNTDQQVNTHSKLKEDFIALQDAYETLKKEGRCAAIETKQLHSKLRKMEDQHEKNQQDVERLENKVKSTIASNENVQRSLKSAEDKVMRLESEIDSAKEDFQRAENTYLEHIARLTSDVDIAKQELSDAEGSSRNDIVQLQSQIKLLTAKNDKFRQMLIPVSEKQVLDAEVVQSFTSLRSSMLALVRRTWKLAFRDDVDLRGLSKDQIYIFKSGGTCNYDRLRYAVFYFIHHRIIGIQNYFLENGFEETEQRLQLVEQELIEKSPVENRKLVMEWRSASFKATECFRGSGRVLSRDTQNQIWNFFGPLQTANPAAEEIGRKKLKEICDAAVALSLTIRQLKDSFWIDDMRRALGKPVSEWDQFVEEMASVAAGKERQPGTIAYVIVGALVKNPREDLEKVLVLEKAEVGVYR